MEMESNTSMENGKERTLFNRVMNFVVYVWILAMMFIFSAMILFIDYLAFSVAEKLNSINGLVNPPTQLKINVDASGFFDYFLRYQLIIILIGIVAFLFAVKFINFIIKIGIRPVWDNAIEHRREAWRKYLNNKFTMSKLTKDQISGLNLRKKANESDIYVFLALLASVLSVLWIILVFFELDNLGDESNNSVTIIIFGVIIISILLFLRYALKRENPLYSVEKEIKSDQEWKEFLEKHDKENLSKNLSKKEEPISENTK